MPSVAKAFHWANLKAHCVSHILQLSIPERHFPMFGGSVLKWKESMFSERLLLSQGFVNLLFGGSGPFCMPSEGERWTEKGGKENRAWRAGPRVALTFWPVTCFCLLSFIKPVIYTPLTTWQRVLMRMPLDTTKPTGESFVITNSLLIQNLLIIQLSSSQGSVVFTNHYLKKNDWMLR